jgi:hypothetical protein
MRLLSHVKNYFLMDHHSDAVRATGRRDRQAENSFGFVEDLNERTIAESRIDK